MAFIKHANSIAELDTILDSKGSGLTVVDFHATWCGPCHTIAPKYAQLSDAFRHVAFVKVDVDKAQPVARKYNVSSMPTFVFIKNKQVVAELQGADQNGLENLVRQHAPAANAASSSEGTVGDVSLSEYLDGQQINCLNEMDNHTLKSILSSKGKSSTEAYLSSDADEQLLLNIQFNQTVRIRSIKLQSKNTAFAPKFIKLFINKPALGFEDVEDAAEPEAAQVLELDEDVVTNGKHVNLRFVRFQSVNSLHIFVASNQGSEEVTQIDSIDVFGLPVESTKDLSGLRN